jgi:hypothetical protein
MYMLDFARAASGVFVALIVGLIGGFTLRTWLKQGSRKHRSNIKIVENWRRQRDK